MPELTGDRLAAILASVADHLVVPAGSTASSLTGGSTASVEPAPSAELVVPTNPGVGVAGDPSSNGSGSLSIAPEPTPDVRPLRRRQRRQQGWMLAVAAVVVAVAGVVGAIVAPVREAVAGWLGIGSTEVVRVGVGEGDPAELPFLGTGLTPADRAMAEEELGAPLPDTGETELGPAPVLAIPPEGGVIMAWADGATTLWVRGDAPAPGQTVWKLLTLDDRFERVDGLGDAAAAVEGPHVLVTPLRRLAAGTVLVWVDAGFEHRLESDLDRAQMEAIARSIGPAG